MRSDETRVRILAIGIASVIALTSCAPGSKGEIKDIEQAGTLTVGVASLGPERFIPRLTQGPESPVMLAFGETLTRLDLETRKVLPNLATSWSLENRGGQWTWTFKLRDGIQFNEGQGRLTADDVQFTFSECLKKDVINSVCPLLRDAVDGDIANFRVIGPLDFELRSKRAVSDLAYFLSDGPGSPIPMLPKGYYEKVGDVGFAEHPIGAGPFVFKSFVSHQEFTFEAVPRHFRKTPNVKTLRLRVIPEVSTAVAGLKSADIDMVSVGIAFAKELQASNLKTTRIKSAANTFVALGGQYYDLPEKNCVDCPWVGNTANALKVREAMTIAIDREAILKNLMLGEGQPAAAPFSWVPGPSEFNDASWAPPPYDPAKAKRLLTEAGYSNGFPIKFAILAGLQLPELPDISELVATSWEQVGLKVDRQRIEFTPTFRAKMVDRTTAGYAWAITIATPPNPLADMPRLFSPKGSLAYLHDSAIDRAIADAENLVQPADRFALARKLGSDIIARRLGIPLFSVNTVVGLSKRIDGTQFLLGQYFLGNFEYVSLARN